MGTCMFCDHDNPQTKNRLAFGMSDCRATILPARGRALESRTDRRPGGGRLRDMGTATSCRLSSEFPRSGPEPKLICKSVCMS